MNISSINNYPNPIITLHSPTNYLKFNPQFRTQTLILCAANRKNRYGFTKSSKLIFNSAFLIASKLRLIPEPLEFLFQQFGNENGNGGGNGFRRFRFNNGGSDGWKRNNNNSRKMKWGILFVICGVGLWLVTGNNEVVLDGDTFLYGLGLVLLGLSVGGWRNGGNKDWVLGFCCCAFAVGLVTRKDEVRKLVVRGVEAVRMMTSGGRSRRRKWRLF